MSFSKVIEWLKVGGQLLIASAMLGSAVPKTTADNPYSENCASYQINTNFQDEEVWTSLGKLLNNERIYLSLESAAMHDLYVYNVNESDLGDYDGNRFEHDNFDHLASYRGNNSLKEMDFNSRNTINEFPSQYIVVVKSRTDEERVLKLQVCIEE